MRNLQSQGDVFLRPPSNLKISIRFALSGGAALPRPLHLYCTSEINIFTRLHAQLKE